MRPVSVDEVVQLIGSTNLSIAASAYDDDGAEAIATGVVRSLRRLAEIPEGAIITYDTTERRYRLVTSPKAVARIQRDGKL